MAGSIVVRQLAEQKQMTEALQTQVSKLTALLENQITVNSGNVIQRQTNNSTVVQTQKNTGTVIQRQTNNTGTVIQSQTNNISVYVHPWDGHQCINVEASQIAEAFSENARIREYASLGDICMATQSSGSPYVMEILMDLLKRAHEDPANRNVYLDPRRSDQTLVLKKDGKWEVLPLAEASRKLFDSIIYCMNLQALSPKMEEELPMEARNALGIAGMLYNEEPEGYIKRAKGSMAAHLTNCREKIDVEKTCVMDEDDVPERREVKYPTTSRLPVMVPRTEPVGPNLSPERAAALLCAEPPVEADENYIKELSKKAGVEPDYLIKKLWEATDDGLLLGDLAKRATEIIEKYDEDPAKYI
jgi:hypothetical protein